MCVCMHFIYSCTLLNGTQGPHLGGWDSLLRLHSLCQARWLLSLSEEEERWKDGRMEGKGGSSESPLNSARVARPQSHHIWRPPAAGSARFPPSFVPFFCTAHAHFLTVFPDGGGVFGQAVICAHISATLVSLLRAERRGGGEERRWWCESKAKYHFIL